MKILLDECVHRKMGGFLPSHVVKTVVQAGWEGIKNGELLNLASSEFDVFITVDRNLAFQQNPRTLPIPVIIIHAPSTQLKELEKFVPQILKTLEKKLLNTFTHLS